jgi:hypothetical protein
VPDYPRPRRRDFPTLGSYQNALERWEMIRDSERQERRRSDRERRVSEYRDATSRPSGTLEAGKTTADGRSAYYEDGGSTGQREGHRDRYSGPEGPFGPGHHHDGSEDGGETWERYH